MKNLFKSKFQFLSPHAGLMISHCKNRLNLNMLFSGLRFLILATGLSMFSATSAVAQFTETLPAGTLIIAMDNENQASDTRIRQAYGLAVRLLRAGVPLKWIIKPTKTVRTEADFTASARQRYPAPIGTYSSRSFYAGPIAIFPGYETQAANLIATLTASTGSNVRIFELQNATSVTVNSNLTHKPFVFVENGKNEEIHIDILEAAGLQENTHFSQGLLTTVTSTSCVTIITVPHNDEITDAQRTTVRDFLRGGGNFLAQCAAVRAFQNNAPSTFTGAGFVDKPGLDEDNFAYSNPTEPSAQFQGDIPDEGGSLPDFGFITQPTGGTKIVHGINSEANNYKAYTGRIDGVTTVDGGYIHYLAGHKYDGDIDADRYYLNAVLRSATRPSNCNLCINPLSNLAVSDPTICNGQTASISITASEIGVSYQLRLESNDNNVGAPVAGTGGNISFSVNPSSTTVYNILASRSGCSVELTDKATVTVNTPATATAGGPNTVCQSATPSAITLSGASVGGGATTGAWSIISGGGTLSSIAQTATPATVTYTPAANFSGTVTLRLTTNDPTGPCTAVTADRTITVNPLPTLSLAVSSPTICVGESATISVSNSQTGVTYQLRLNSDNSNVGAAVAGNGGTINFSVNPGTTTVYNVLATNTTTTCSAQLTATSTVTVNPLPTISLAVSSPTICVGESATISVSNSQTGVSYQLRLNSDNSNVGAAVAGNGGTINFSVSPGTTTVYNVLATNTTTTCSAQLTATSTVTVNPLPTISLAISSPTICVGESATISVSNSQTGVSYQLRLNSDNSNVGAAVAGNGGTINFSVSPGTTTVYNVLATNTTTTCSAQLTATSTVTVVICTFDISGTVFNDTDGLTNGQVDGTGTNGGGLNAILINSSNQVAEVATVMANGSYEFFAVPNGTYSILISTANPSVGDAPPAVIPPAGWVITGEDCCDNSGSDGNPDGILTGVVVDGSNVSNANFGIQPFTFTTTPSINSGCIDDKPFLNYSLVTNFNPTGLALTITWNRSGNTTGLEDMLPGATPIDEVIRTVPAIPGANVTNNGNGTWTTTGTDLWPGAVLDINDNVIDWPGWVLENNVWLYKEDGFGQYRNGPTVTFSINPDITSDPAVYPPSTPSCNTNPPGLSITGKVFNDTDGLTNLEVDGLNYTNEDLNAVLVASNNLVAAVVPVDEFGNFTFTNVVDATFTVLITNTAVTAGDAAPTVTLPAGWVSTGEFVGIGAGNDGLPANSILSVVVNGANVSNVRLGIQQPPIAGNGANNGLNKSGTQQVTVPANTFTNGNGIILKPSTDEDPGTVSSIRITGFPTGASSIVINGIAYYPTAGDVPVTCAFTSCLVWPSIGVPVLTDGNGAPTVPVTVDPTDPGFTQIIIPFVAIDNAGFESANQGEAILNLVPSPDLTPTIDLPSNTFNPDQVKNVVLIVEEVNNIGTAPGVTTFGLSAPVGYEILGYDGNLLEMAPSGGNTAPVNNTEFEVILSNSAQIVFRAKAGVSISARSFKAVGIQLKRTSALNGSVSNITINITTDPTLSYDSNDFNNIFSRILNAQ